MSEMKHTPGPWLYADRAPMSVGSAWVSSDEVHQIALCDGTRNGTHGFCYVMNDGENEANARLIAAAPELLEALILSLNAANEMELSSAHFPREKIQSAIAKATQP